MGAAGGDDLFLRTALTTGLSLPMTLALVNAALGVLNLVPIANLDGKQQLAWSLLARGGTDADREAEAVIAEALAGQPTAPGFLAIRGSALIASGRIDDGLPLVAACWPHATTDRERANVACWIAIGEAGRGAIATAVEQRDLARRCDPNCEFLARADAAIDAAPRAPTAARAGKARRS